MSTSQPPFIQISNVSKAYQRGAQRVAVLDQVSLEVQGGAFEAIMGPSGSGKTTLLNLISGIDRPDSGQVKVGGIDIGQSSQDDLADWRLRHVGFVFQFYNLLPVLTAFQNVELPLIPRRLSARERRRRVSTALEVVGLSARAEHYPNQLSGGQEQRVGIARAIVADPMLIVADEPTGDLDRESADEILKLLTVLNKDLGKTIVMVTHDPDAARCSDRVHQVDKGALRRDSGLRAAASA
jgi:putative ABC transport system ATP-binding protein